MCGIIGFTGYLDAAEVLMDGLSALEYRGYDSAGIACFVNRKIVTEKSVGKVARLNEKIAGKLHSSCGIGHTRWATHGGVSEVNAHPHSCGRVTLIHNGIIENYHSLAGELARGGRRPVSQTDSEIAAMLIDSLYEEDPKEAIQRAVPRLEGAYAFCILFSDRPGIIYCIRKGSPLVICHTEEGSVVASDMVALLRYSKDYFVLPENQIAVLTANEIEVTDLNGKLAAPQILHVNWDMSSAQKNGYKHYMLKEIHEQPKAVQDTVGAYVKDEEINLLEAGITDELLSGLERIYIVACGSAYHVGMVAKYVMEDLADVPVEVDLASEFRYRNPKLEENSLVIVVSQSGETADSLAALRLAKEKGVPVLGIVNVVGSSIARESDYILYTYAGPEISVATTKAYSTQLIAVYLLAVQMAFVKGIISEERYAGLLQELERLPEKIQKTLDDKERIQWFASKYANAKDIFFIGRGIDYAISLEGSLKMKEISYIHSEAYAAGELKHGTISLVEEGTLVVGVLTQQALFEKTLSNMVETKSRGAYLMGLTLYGNYSIEDNADFSVYVPKTEQYFTTSLAIVPLQLMGYYVSVAKGLDVDKPRNLAKSVTVE